MNAGIWSAPAGRHRRDRGHSPAAAINPGPLPGLARERTRGRAVTFAVEGLHVLIPSRYLRRWGQRGGPSRTGDSPAEEFDHRQPFDIGHGDAAEIADFLRKS